MTEHDLAELHAYLQLFHKVYDDREDEVTGLMETVQEIFVKNSGDVRHDGVLIAMKTLKNPRGAGRKSKTTPETVSRIMGMFEGGKSIRKISEETKIPKSTVQRIITSQK